MKYYRHLSMLIIFWILFDIRNIQSIISIHKIQFVKSNKSHNILISPLSFIFLALFVSGCICSVVVVCRGAVWVEIWPRGGVHQYLGCCERRQCHCIWQGVFMGAGGVVHCMCTAPPRPCQKQRIFTVLQTDAGTKIPANQRPFCRYNCFV